MDIESGQRTRHVVASLPSTASRLTVVNSTYPSELLSQGQGALPSTSSLTEQQSLDGRLAYGSDGMASVVRTTGGACRLAEGGDGRDATHRCSAPCSSQGEAGGKFADQPHGRAKVASMCLSFLSAALVMSACLLPSWLIRSSKRLLLVNGVGDVVVLNSSAVSLGLFSICEYTTLDQCFSYLTASDSQHSRILWDVDYHRDNGKLLACQSLSLLALVSAIIAMATMLCHLRVGRTVLKFRCLLFHALAALITCLSSILCAVIFFFWSSVTLRRTAATNVLSMANSGDFFSGRFLVSTGFGLICAAVMMSLATSIIAIYVVSIAPRKSLDFDSEATDVSNPNHPADTVATATSSRDLPPPYSQQVPSCTCSQHASSTAGQHDSHSQSCTSGATPQVLIAMETHTPPVRSVQAGVDIPRNLSSSSVGSVASTMTAMSSISSDCSLSSDQTLQQATSLTLCSRCNPEPLLSPQELMVRFTEFSTGLHFQCSVEVLNKDTPEFPPPYCPHDAAV